MSYITAEQAINEWIVQNGNNEITADVLRPVLLKILQAAKDTTGELTNLGTPTQENLVAAINYLLNIIPPGSAGVKVYTGMPDPNITPPPSFQYADFYMQIDSGNIPIQLWQWNGNNWVVVSYGGGGGSLDTQTFIGIEGASQIFAITDGKFTKQVHVSGAYVPKSLWSQAGSNLTVTWDFFDGDEVDVLVQ